MIKILFLSVRRRTLQSKETLRDLIIIIMKIGINLSSRRIKSIQGRRNKTIAVYIIQSVDLAFRLCRPDEVFYCYFLKKYLVKPPLRVFEFGKIIMDRTNITFFYFSLSVYAWLCYTICSSYYTDLLPTKVSEGCSFNLNTTLGNFSDIFDARPRLFGYRRQKSDDKKPIFSHQFHRRYFL